MLFTKNRNNVHFNNPPSRNALEDKGENTKYKVFCYKAPLSISLLEHTQKTKPLKAAYIISVFKNHGVLQRLQLLAVVFIPPL